MILQDGHSINIDWNMIKSLQDKDKGSKEAVDDESTLIDKIDGVIDDLKVF